MSHGQLMTAANLWREAVAISRFGDGGQLMTAANLCLEAVSQFAFVSSGVNNRRRTHKQMHIVDFTCPFTK